MIDIAIKVENLSKCYQIYDNPRDRLKQFVLPRLRRMMGKSPKQYFREFWVLNSTLSDYMIYLFQDRHSGIHVRLSCLTPFGLMQICSRQICAGIQAPWMGLRLPSMALDTRLPAGMTGLRINLTK